MLNADQKDTLYYDGDCPLCRAEMTKLARHAGDQIVLQDIHQLDDSDTEDRPAKETLLARLHLQTDEGEWLTGVEANVRAWQHTRFAWVWRLLTLPFMKHLSEYAYESWLKSRQRKSKACSKCQ